MPISSQGKRRSVAATDKANRGSSSSGQPVWKAKVVASSENRPEVGQNSHQAPQVIKQKKQSTFQIGKTKATQIRQISQPNSCATTSMALSNRLTETTTNRPTDYQSPLKAPTLSLAGQLILAGKQPASLESKAADLASSPLEPSKAPASLSLIGAGHHHQQQQQQYKFNQNHHQADFYLSRSSLNQQQQPSQASSTTQLQPNHRHNNNGVSTRLNISSRNMNLKYVKTLIIILMGLDLLMTILLHQFATQDQVQLWLTTYKLRFSLLNLVLSAIWFVVLTGAILFDVHFILLIACIVDVGSFVLLLILSITHFYKRIDYNTVQLTSLLALLFSIIFLHVYLLALSVLTIYLTGAVRRRKRSTLI